MKTSGQILRELRESKQLPLRTVAAFLDMDQAILSKMERGQRKFTRDHVLKLAEYYQANKDELLVAWLSDKLLYELKNDTLALKALKVAEEKVAYQTYKKTDRNKLFSILKNYFKKETRITKAWVFGSFARGDDGPFSDIDVMVEIPKNSKFSLFDFADIQHQLEQLLNRKIDLVEQGAIKPFAWATAKNDLKILYER